MSQPQSQPRPQQLPSLREKFFAFLLGIAVMSVVCASFFLGAIADRLFVIRPLDVLFKRVTGDNSTFQQLFQGTPHPAAPAFTDANTIPDVADRASRSVVTITVKRQQRTLRSLGGTPFGGGPLGDLFGLTPFGENFRQPVQDQEIKQDIGSGFVVDSTGLVVTNRHVVSDASAEYSVIDRDDKEHKVEKIYRDQSSDLAILKVTDLTAPVLDMGDSEQLRVGQPVIAIGTALGEFRHTVTTGVISGIGRSIEAGDGFSGRSESLENVIQTDAAINPGNSGGPLLDAMGRVIGVNTAVSAQGQNIGFALPINIIKQSIETFNRTGQFDRPMLGVSYQLISEQSALLNGVPQGAYVVAVLEKSAAADAGIKVGDIITEFDGQRLKKAELIKLINQKKIGDTVTLKVWREDKEISLTATLKGQS